MILLHEPDLRLEGHKGLPVRTLYGLGLHGPIVSDIQKGNTCYAMISNADLGLHGPIIAWRFSVKFRECVICKTWMHLSV